MNLDNSDAGCVDSLQFARDVFFVTNYKSKQFCGVRPKLDLIRSEDAEAAHPTPRLYVEDRDHEMDIWLSVKRSDSSDTDENWKPRNLTLVVTVFKQGCGSKDNYYRPCPNTQNCIRYLGQKDC